MKAILIEGNSDGTRRTSCDLFFKEGTEMVVYANEGSDGQYIFNSCSGYRILGKRGTDSDHHAIAMLDVLADQKN